MILSASGCLGLAQQDINQPESVKNTSEAVQLRQVTHTSNCKFYSAAILNNHRKLRTSLIYASISLRELLAGLRSMSYEGCTAEDILKCRLDLLV